MYVTCSLCGLVVPMPNVDTGSLPTCKCKMQITFSDHATVSPTSTEGFRIFIKNMHDWNVTLHGSFAREPVPDAFQHAFKDGELEL